MSSKLNRLFSAKSGIAAVGITGVSLWAYVFFNNSNQSIAHTSLFKGILYEFRRNPQVSEWAGVPVGKLGYNHKWIGGSIQTVRGKGDVVFGVDGGSEPITVRFKGRKKPDRDEWIAEVFLLKKADGSVLQM